MKVAVTYENGEVFQHFGRTPQFKIYEIDNGEVKAEQVIDTGETGHGALAGFLKDLNVNVMICGGIGGGAIAAMAESGIKVYAGASGKADDVIKSSGYRIGPSEVEDILLEHEAVKECAVTGYPSATRGELVKASIILENGYEKTPELKRTLQDFVKSRTALYKYPRVIEFVDDMPRSTSGKISRRLIRDNDLKKAQMK